MNRLRFTDGIRDSIPIALGYLSVSFGFGIMASGAGLSPLTAALISLCNVTSAGQVAGLSVMTAGGTLFEMALTQLVINMRYALMSLSLSQKMDKSFTIPHRLASSFFITDEIFAVAAGKACDVNKKYMYGLGILPVLSWTLGTFLGAVAGELLPEAVKNALGIAIYGMFVAIVIPASKKSAGTAAVVAAAVAISCALKYIPAFSFISPGFAVIICAVAAALAGAVFFPVPSSDDKEAE